jgi:hypothetical protein
MPEASAESRVDLLDSLLAQATTPANKRITARISIRAELLNMTQLRFRKGVLHLKPAGHTLSITPQAPIHLDKLVITNDQTDSDHGPNRRSGADESP